MPQVKPISKDLTILIQKIWANQQENIEDQIWDEELETDIPRTELLGSLYIQIKEMEADQLDEYNHVYELAVDMKEIGAIEYLTFTILGAIYG